jgi:(p)ppGpp synthase/HD superfamily hydrolase
MIEAFGGAKREMQRAEKFGPILDAIKAGGVKSLSVEQQQELERAGKDKVWRERFVNSIYQHHGEKISADFVEDAVIAGIPKSEVLDWIKKMTNIDAAYASPRSVGGEMRKAA